MVHIGISIYILINCVSVFQNEKNRMWVGLGSSSVTTFLGSDRVQTEKWGSSCTLFAAPTNQEESQTTKLTTSTTDEKQP